MKNPPHIPDHELLRVIGRGSYGEVWLARNMMGTLRAVKVVERAAFDHDRPFQREYEGLQRYEPVSRSHEGLVQVLHAGRAEDFSFFYYVMEPADNAGPPDDYAPLTLRALMNARGALPMDECVRLGLEMTAAAAHLHREGLVHRDLKPSNIIIAGGRPKLADLGLVSPADDSRSIVGTEGFIPPEGSGTPAADVFSMGRILYEMATGFDRHDFPRVPAAWLERGADAGGLEFNEVLLRACEPSAAARYANAEELYADLALLHSGKSMRRLRGLERRVRWFRRAVPVAAALLLLAGAGWWAAHRESRAVREGLHRSLTAQARAERRSSTASARFDALHALREAAAILPTPELRDEAIACLALTGAQPRPEKSWTPAPAANGAIASTPDLRVWFDVLGLHVSAGGESPRRIQHGPILMQAAPVVSPDGRWLAARSVLDRRTRLYDLTGALPVYVAERASTAGSFGRGGVWVECQDGPQLAVIDPHSGNVQHTSALPETMREVVAAPSRSIAACSGSAKGVYLAEWGVDKPRAGVIQADTLLRGLSWSADSTVVVAGGDDFGVHVFETESGALIARLTGHSGVVVSTAIHPRDSIVASAAWDGTIRFWDWNAGAQTAVLEDAGTHLRYSPDGGWLGYQTWQGGTAQWCASAPPRLARVLPVAAGAGAATFYAADFSADGTRFAAAGDAGFLCWTGSFQSRPEWHRESAYGSVFWSPGQQSFTYRQAPAAAAGGWELRAAEQGVAARHAQGREIPIALPGAAAPIVHVAVSPDGNWGAACSFPSPGAWLWPLHGDGTAGEVQRLAVTGNAQPGFSPDSRWLVLGDSVEFAFIDVATHQRGMAIPRRSTANHKGPHAFTADGALLAVAETRTLIRLHDARSGRPLAALESPLTPMVNTLNFSPDATRLIAAGGQGRVIHWDLAGIRRELSALGLAW